MQAFAGIDPVPAAADHGLAVVRGHRGHDLVRRVIAPGEPGGRRRLDRLDHAREKIRSLHDILRQAPAFQEGRQCCLSLGTVDAIDRRGIVARDQQQPLNAGKPCLLVVILAVFGKISDQIAIARRRRIDLGKRSGRLPAAALASRGDDEIIGRDAQRIAAALWNG